MKKLRKALFLFAALSLLCAVSVRAEDTSSSDNEYYLDSSMRTPALYVDTLRTYDDYFTLLVPDDWEVADLSEEDIENGILDFIADNLDTPALTLTVSQYTPDECTEIFGGTGYDAIYDCIAEQYEDTVSACINDTWTIVYSKEVEDHQCTILDMTTADGYMYQIRFDIYDEDALEIMNNIAKSLESL